MVSNYMNGERERKQVYYYFSFFSSRDPGYFLQGHVIPTMLKLLEILHINTKKL